MKMKIEKGRRRRKRKKKMEEERIRGQKGEREEATNVGEEG